jgi:two-component system CheB/CheR fusion protein
VLRVADTGIGIAADVLPCIFDLFMQGERSIDRTQGGLGIGLTLVRRLVEMHNGTVRATSAGAGQGSELVIELPFGTSQTPAAKPAAAPAQSGGARRVLVVDDNVDAARTLAEALAAWGHTVRVAHDASTALAEAARERPDVVLLDLGLPGMDGYEVARQLRSRPESSSVLLVALSGYGQERDRQRSREAGFKEHLVKPVELQALAALVESA